ncbi:MauE/DoxX family redox-associated membrane protein [Caballeronia sp. BR00000012568055]|uniref:MauE/DoxX family redox-associated membrane protein n=1 Tax=Caballeronia sp. BR00000012568055 TaxID=2918761 RepID=UPI0023F710A4|nr:MauE/DoxX family redox-associated membrane protein [Caballeronia sp. BR00000012568055]
MLDPVILMMCIATVTIVTLASAAPKWLNPERFRASVEAFALLPSFAVTPVSYALPVLEAGGAIGLLFDVTRLSAACVLIALFGVFTLALAINVWRGHTDIDCGCSGFIAEKPGIGRWHVGRAALLVLFACLTLLPQAGRALVWFDYLSAGACTLFFVAAWFTLDVLLNNLPKLDSLRNS